MDKNIFKKLTYGLYIISSNFENNFAGCIVNTVTQITSNNPIIAVSVNKNNYTNLIIKKSKKIAISILSMNTNKELINKFGFYSSKDVNKFEDINYELVNDIPIVIENMCGYIQGEIIDIVDVDTHDIFLIKVTNTKIINNDEPLTYTYYLNNMKGISPKNAPTYIEKDINTSTANKYQCIVCGHIYDDGVEEIPFDELPDDWVCPICGVTKDKFKKIN